MASVKNKGNGAWLITISDGYRPDGSQKRIYRTFHANPKSTESAQQKQAEKYAARLQTECDDKKINDKKKITFKKVYEDYVQDRLVRKGLAQQTIDSYKKLFESRIIPEFGNTPIREIETDDVNRFLRKLEKGRKVRKTKGKKQTSTDSDNKEPEEKKLSGTYCLKYFQQLNELFVYARMSKHITMNPCDDVIPPQRDTQEAQYYDLPECAKIIKLLAIHPETEWKAFFSLAFYCGCRPGELIGLNWSDFDGTDIFVQAGSYKAKGEEIKRTDKPKTKKSIRRISLTPEAIAALNAWKSEQAVQRLKCGEYWQDPAAVFTNEEGRRVSSQTPSKAWKRFTAENKLRHLPLYDLRHTNCSLLISSRELSVEEVAARMGHEQTSTTLNIYSHAFANSNARATEALTNVLKKAANEN